MCRARSVAEALGMVHAALDYLNGCDPAGLPTETQAEALRGLAAADAKQTAARSAVLGAFTAQRGYEDDGQGSATGWLRWQTRATQAAAAGAAGWAKRLADCPAVHDALAAGEISPSWAQAACGWCARLPGNHRQDAAAILVTAARAGADLRDLAGLAREIYERCPPGGEDDSVTDRYLRLGVTFRGAGRVEGDLTPGCAAAVGSVLEALGKRAGPEDTPTPGQWRHDALEEACRRLMARAWCPAGPAAPRARSFT
jgi:Domain of unknown function (DUF222)